MTSTTKFLRPFGIKNFNEFLKKKNYFGKATLNRLKNALVSNVTLPKAELILKIIYIQCFLLKILLSMAINAI
jgi:hypothetical protein